MSNNTELLDSLKNKLSDQIVEAKLNLGDVEIRIQAEDLVSVFQILKVDSDFNFNFFVNVTCVDYFDTDFMERGDERFELVYHLLSLKTKNRLRIKVSLEESKPEIDSLCSLWEGANFMEREVYDMFGIKFNNHPNLKRILMYDEFEGYPLRKDYPIQGKQPRVKLRHPEVENTARDMNRSSLIQINPKGANE